MLAPLRSLYRALSHRLMERHVVTIENIQRFPLAREADWL
jgi:hypothetical protein